VQTKTHTKTISCLPSCSLSNSTKPLEVFVRSFCLTAGRVPDWTLAETFRESSRVARLVCGFTSQHRTLHNTGSHHVAAASAKLTGCEQVKGSCEYQRFATRPAAIGTAVLTAVRQSPSSLTTSLLKAVALPCAGCVGLPDRPCAVQGIPAAGFQADLHHSVPRCESSSGGSSSSSRWAQQHLALHTAMYRSSGACGCPSSTLGLAVCSRRLTLAAGPAAGCRHGIS
jgi:hypothetical protein